MSDLEKARGRRLTAGGPTSAPTLTLDRFACRADVGNRQNVTCNPPRRVSFVFVEAVISMLLMALHRRECSCMS